MGKTNKKKLFQAASYLEMGHIEQQQNRLPAALVFFRKAEKIYRAQQNRKGVVQAMNGIGNVFADQRQFHQALEVYQTALGITKEEGIHHGTGVITGNMASIYHQMRRVEISKSYYLEAIAIHRENDVRRSEAVALSSLAQLYAQELDDYQQALEYLHEALKISKEVQLDQLTGRLLVQMGIACRTLGKPKDAIEYLEQAENFYESLDSQCWDSLQMQIELAKEQEKHGAVQEAIVFLNRLLEQTRINEVVYFEIQGLYALATIQLKHEQQSNVVETVNRAIHLAEESNIQHPEVLQGSFALLLAKAGAVDDAFMLIKNQRTNDINEPFERIEWLCNVIEIQMIGNKKEASKVLLEQVQEICHSFRPDSKSLKLRVREIEELLGNVD